MSTASSTLHPDAWLLSRNLAQDGGVHSQVANLFDVSGWVCVVTGGGTGVGLGIAATLAHNGAKVYIVGRRLEVLEEAAEQFKPSGKGCLVPVQGDMSSQEGMETLVKEIASKEKHLDLLVNNHSYISPGVHLKQCDGTPEGISKQVFARDSLKEWQTSFGTNVGAYYFLIFGFLPLLARASTAAGAARGSVINMTSLANQVRRSDFFSYQIAKATVVRMTTMVAAELAARKLQVRVNAIELGDFPSEANKLNYDPEKEADKEDVERRMPLGLGRATELARAVLSLATNTYVSGTSLTVDGGQVLVR